MSRVVAVVVGAGSGSRFGGPVPKQYRPLEGVPVFRRSLACFVEHPAITAVLPVVGAGDGDRFAAMADGLATLPPVPGGDTRSASVRAALGALAADPPTHVLIHDAARPLTSPTLIDRVVAALATHDAVVPGTAVRDTLKRTRDGCIEATVDRAHLYAVQTPQGFAYPLLREAYTRAGEATDDAALVEAVGVPVAVIEGEVTNMKITEAGDLEMAARLLGAAAVPRVGTGFDVHRLGDGNGIRLGGVLIASRQALLGHSDADVALHALTDALLGTLGIGDIGTLFPPSDMRWKGADSAIFIREACRRIDAAAGRIAHLDLTILCERPKIGPHREAMRQRIAELCAVDMRMVSVKATTTERLGFTGRGEGIAAQAAATVLYPA